MFIFLLGDQVIFMNSMYREKILGCWLGKAVGGTLGAPYEGSRGPLSLDFYNPVPSDMLPNDDLDLQVLWAYALERNPLIHRRNFSEAWLKHVHFPWDEYGIALRNLSAGIPAPESGRYDNWFTNGLGAAIRSEIWACLAPGDSVLAARYAREDACVDHAGEGLYAEQFLSALESMAFVESDPYRLLEAGLSVIPCHCILAKAIRSTMEWCGETSDWLAVRAKILEHYGSQNFTDVVMNIPFVVLALLLGGGEFGRTICLAVNCGYDADCTGATAGAIMGILSSGNIPDQWLAPIGRKLIINKGIVGITHPATLDEFTDQIIRLREVVSLEEDAGSSTSCKAAAGLTAECGVFQPWFVQDCGKFTPKLPTKSVKRTFSGNMGRIASSEVPQDALYMMRFSFALPERKKVRILFNTPAISRVWLDGQYAFGRDGGGMYPSFHRAPLNQFTDVTLDAGTHELLAGVARRAEEAEIEWVVGVGDGATLLWLPVFVEA